MSIPHTIRFVLVGSENPGNVGAAARAIKTMGLGELWLAGPVCDPRAAEARFLAHNAEDVLENVKVVNTLEEALADAAFSVATSQRPRRAGVPYYTAAEVAPLVLERAAAHRVAIIFGRESSRLTNDELARCSVLSTVPSATRVPALNVAQAVMIYAYELHQASQGPQAASYQWDLAEHAQLEQFYQHLERTLASVGATPAVSWEGYIEKFRRVFGRVPLESRDVLLLHKLLEEVDRFVSRGR
ncbi:MAG: RNA methyltransferase [Planctomycetes bacterium]|nr:RNA methyltransferase [Planctomycetota bacterium]